MWFDLAAFASCAAARAPIPWRTARGTPITTEAVVYGPYWSVEQAAPRADANTLYLSLPVAAPGPYPVVVQIHGGAFTGGAAQTACDARCEALLDRGIAYASVGYRLDGTRYYYCDDRTTACFNASSARDAEFVDVDADGRLSLARDGRTLVGYAPRVGRQELNAQCAYDAARALDALLARGDVDARALAFAGSSAGGGEIHYLCWVYRAFSPVPYTPHGVVYNNAQLDYPVQNALVRVWGRWADGVGADVALPSVLDAADCAMVIGNPCCEPECYGGCGDDTAQASVRLDLPIRHSGGRQRIRTRFAM